MLSSDSFFFFNDQQVITVMTVTRVVHDMERGHNCYDHPVITVMTVTLVHDGREIGQYCYDHPVITVMTGLFGREVITVMTTRS